MNLQYIHELTMDYDALWWYRFLCVLNFLLTKKVFVCINFCASKTVTSSVYIRVGSYLLYSLFNFAFFRKEVRQKPWIYESKITILWAITPYLIQQNLDTPFCVSIKLISISGLKMSKNVNIC